MPIYLEFIDYHKAFDKVEKWSVLAALNPIIHVRIDDDLSTDNITFEKRIRQKLFTLALEDVLKHLN